MSSIKPFLFVPLFFFLCHYQAYSQDLILTELMASNRGVVYDEDKESSDWIEIYNRGNSRIKLDDYYLSDNINMPEKWQLPESSLSPKQSLLIFASGKDRRNKPSFWYSPAQMGDSCSYIIPDENTAANWKNIGFNDAEWEVGKTGIGYGDDDDNTTVPKNTRSVFLRMNFSLEDSSIIQSAWFHMDYDDGFIAYLNGTEIARRNMGEAGSAVAFDKIAEGSHEANIYRDLEPDAFNISEQIQLLRNGKNVLAVQVHNGGVTSSDLTANPFLSLEFTESVSGLKSLSELFDFDSRNPHTNFKLSGSGEIVLLSHKNTGIVDSVSFGVIPGDYSFGRSNTDYEVWGFLQNPTPGYENNSILLSEKVESEVDFSIQEMFLSSEKNLVLSGASNAEEIRYTLNSDEPDANSRLYSAAISITKNTVVKARIISSGKVPGKVATRTFIFDEAPTLPVIAVATGNANLWDNETGMYVLGYNYEEEMPHKGANYWEDWEKPASFEMAEKDGTRLFSLNCGIKIFGGWSRTQDQKSLSVFFRNAYGDSKINNVKLFESKSIKDFNSVVLRNSGNDYSFTKFRDGMMTSLVRNLDIDISAYKPTIMYLNGEYWGIINLREKLNEDFIENNWNVKADEIDLMEWNGSAIEGNSDNYWSLIDYLTNNDLTQETAYEAINERIDISNYFDYQLSQIYFDNKDWPGNNIKYWRPQTEDGKWRWIMFDTDFGFGIYGEDAYKYNTLEFALATDGPDWPNPAWATLIFRKLMENTDLRHRFINRYADMLNTTFQPDTVLAHIDSLARNIEPEIERNFGKWNTPSAWWWGETVNRMKQFGEKRVDYAIDHIKQVFEIESDFEIRISKLPTTGGIVKLNSLQIEDAVWSGKYFKDVPISLTALPFAGYKFHGWMIDNQLITSETIELNLKENTNVRVIFDASDDDGNSVVFNEINYNSPEENNAGDWVELYNWGRNDLDISGWIFKDSNNENEYVIPENTILKSTGYLVLCRNLEDFNKIHSNVNCLGDFDFGLSSSGDKIRLYDKLGQLVDEVSFGTELPWPFEPNGTGPTLELRQYFHNNASSEFWKSSLVHSGTPGMENSITTDAAIFADNSSDIKLDVYPNPFNSEVHIKLNKWDFEPALFQIYSIDGRLVYNEQTSRNEFIWKGENSSGQKVQPGIYICKVKTGNEFFTEKIIYKPF